MARMEVLRMRVPFLVLAIALCSSCAASRASSALEALPLVVAPAAPTAPSAPVKLVEDVFARDHAGSISESDLRRVLDAPVALEENARVGVLPVVDRYDPSHETPVVGAPGSLARALEDTGLFELVSEVSTDFPATTSVAGLRELAARYRADYLLLYRHRFVERARPTPWLVSTAYEAEVVLEATLFDVRSGTILFTVFQRAEGEKVDAPYAEDRARRALRGALVEETSRALGDDVVVKVRRLAGLRPAATAADAR